ncbi:MAG: hypothetical protein ABSH35_14005 [Isosphaeraceae bacterium]|jgi:hypothetical protein
MGENLIEQQIKHFEKRCRIAQIDVKRRSFFERAEIINTVYTVNLNNGSSLKAGDTYLAIVARDGQRIHVAEGHRVVGRIEGDGAKSLAKGLGECGQTGVVRIRMTEVSSLSGCGKAIIIKDEQSS